MSAPNSTFDFMSEGGEMGALTRAHDWRAGPLGDPGQWPEVLKSTLRLVLTSNHPMFIWWGEHLIQFYNDAYRATMGPERHPRALGQAGRACWGEIWPIISPQIEAVMQGRGATWNVDQLVPVTRNGAREDVWWTYGYSPIQDAGGVRGVLVVCNDVTEEHEARAELTDLNRRLTEQVRQRVQAESDLAAQLDMSDKLRGLTDSHEIAEVAFQTLSRRLVAARINYCEIDAAAGAFTIRHAWRGSGLPSVAGAQGALAAFGPALIEDLSAGRAACIADVTCDGRTAPSVAAFDAMDGRAVIIVPILEAGQLVAAMSIMSAAPFEWSGHHVALVEGVAHRIRHAMERARAHEAHIAAQRDRHAQQRAESERLESMFSQAPGFMCILSGPEHVFKFANDAYRRLVGARTLVGKKLRDAVPEIAEQGFLELLDQVYGSARPFVANNVPATIQRSAEGPPSTSYLDFIYQPIVGADGKATGIFVEGFDATERHFAKVALEASEQRLKEGMLAARMVIWDWDLASDRTTFSDNAGILFGGQWQQLAPVWDSLVPEDLARLEAERARALACNGSYEEVVRLVRPDNGETLWLQVHGTVIAADDGTARAIRGVSVDVTERKQAEEALRQAHRRKDEFLAMLAHELRNPLAPISAAAQLLKMCSNDEARVRRSSEVIGRQVEHMTSLISDMLDVSRFNAGLVSLSKELLDLREVVAESTEQTRPLMQLRGHRFEISGVELSLMVLADRTRLVQVLTNLIQNSAKFTPPGGNIRVALETGNAEVSISVSDDGVGMAAELVPHVFELFTQGERSSDRAQGGLGLGLSLVKSLVNLHGGRVRARSGGQDQGSTFTVILPLHGAAAGGPGADRRVVNAAAAGKRALRILVVDDNVDAARMLCLLLEAAGHAVSVAHDPLAVLGGADGAAVDVYLLDIGLPGMDGNALARALRSAPGAAQATLIAVTGYGQKYDRETSLAAGFDYYFIKPANPDQLIALLANIAPLDAPGLTSA